MAKETKEKEVVKTPVITELALDFHREDLNALLAKLNEVIRALNENR